MYQGRSYKPQVQLCNPNAVPQRLLVLFYCYSDFVLDSRVVHCAVWHVAFANKRIYKNMWHTANATSRSHLWYLPELRASTILHCNQIALFSNKGTYMCVSVAQWTLLSRHTYSYRNGRIHWRCIISAHYVQTLPCYSPPPSCKARACV